MHPLLEPLFVASEKKVCVIGDFLLDRYVFGQASRISPEAPVPVLLSQSMQRVPGGAGNVVSNLHALGITPLLVGRVGQDQASQELLEAFASQQIATEGLLVEEGYELPVKQRMVSGGQQLLRVDYEKVSWICPSFEQQLLIHLEEIIESCDVIALSDYGKGLCTPSFLRQVYHLAHRFGKRVVTDPKSKDFRRYSGTSILKPNFSEFIEATDFWGGSEEARAQALLGQIQAQALVVTMAQRGMMVYRFDREPVHLPVVEQSIRDVTGAGDTVLAVMIMALASNACIEDACRLANIGAGVAVGRIGCASVGSSDLLRNLLSKHLDQKIFTPDQLHFIQANLQGVAFHIHEMGEGETVSRALFDELLRKQHHAILGVKVPQSDQQSSILSVLEQVEGIEFLVRG